GRVRVPPTGGDDAPCETVTVRDLNRRRVVYKCPSQPRKLAERPHLIDRNRAVAAAYALDQQRKREEFGGVGLGRRHRALMPGGHVDVMFGGRGQRRCWV